MYFSPQYIIHSFLSCLIFIYISFFICFYVIYVLSSIKYKLSRLSMNILYLLKSLWVKNPQKNTENDRKGE